MLFPSARSFEGRGQKGLQRGAVWWEDVPLLSDLLSFFLLPLSSLSSSLSLKLPHPLYVKVMHLGFSFNVEAQMRKWIARSPISLL